jgi:hypothetical protein
LYVAEVVVVLLKVPQAEPVTPAPETLQVTPLLLVSFITVALKFTV